MVTSVPGPITSSRGSACGSAPAAPEATIESNDGPSAPASWNRSSTRHATSRSVRPISPSSAIPSYTPSSTAAARRTAAISSASLTARSASTTPDCGVSSTPDSSSVSRRWRATVRSPSSKPRVPPSVSSRAAFGQLGQHLALAAPDVRELAQRLCPLHIAEVGQEHRGRRRDDEHRVRAGEAGQVANVDEVGEQQRAQAELLHLLAGTRQPVAVAHPPRSVRCAIASR